MNYEKSLTEIFQWKEESSNELYNLTIKERLKILTEAKKTESISQITKKLHGRFSQLAMLTVKLTRNTHNQSVKRVRHVSY